MTKRISQKMNLFDRAVSFFAPQVAVRRNAARMMLSIMDGRRSFDAVSGGRLRSDWTNISKDADNANVPSLAALRNNVRHLTRNTGIVSGPLKRVTNNVIGTGIRPQSRVKADGPYDNAFGPMESITQEVAESFNYNAEKLWKQWAKKSDAYLIQDIYEQTALAFRSMYGDGESLAVCRSSSRLGRILPLCIEIIEIDRLSTPMSEARNSSIRNGIEFDQEGVPVRYFLLKTHPGSGVSGKSPNDYEVVDAFSPTGARQVLHLYDPLRPGQSRGYTPFAGALKDIQDLDRYREAEVVAARIAACLAAFIKSPADYQMYSGLGTNGQSQKIREFEPGMIEYLNPGEEISVFSANRPNGALGTFTKYMMMSGANAVDLPYEFFANDWAGLNYSNARTVLLQAQLAFRIYQNYMVKHFCQPIWENFIADAIIAGKLSAPGFDLRRDDYSLSVWIPPGWQWVDPVKEANGKQIEVENLFETLSDIYASRGKDFDETIEMRAAELKKIKDIEEKYGVSLTPENKPSAGGASTDGADKEDDQNAEEE